MRSRRKLQNTSEYIRVGGQGGQTPEPARPHRTRTPARTWIGRAVTVSLDGLAIVSVLSIGAAGLLTCTDIVLRNLSLGSIHGMIDITQLAMMYSVFAAIAYAFGKRSHVAVTVLSDLLPTGLSRVLAIAGWLAGVLFLAVLSWAAFGQAKLIFAYGDVSQNLRIPMSLYWLPVVAGLILSAFASFWAIVEEIRN